MDMELRYKQRGLYPRVLIIGIANIFLKRAIAVVIINIIQKKES